MEGKPKMNVIKSKSSYSALVTKNDRKMKKSRNNSKFLKSDVKKRGFYVENKATKSLDTHETDVSQTSKRIKTPPPRPGRKRFLASVLSILSKDTTVSQNPTENQITDAKKDRKRKVVVSDTNEDYFEAEGTITEKISKTEVEEFRKRVRDKKKKKYRSRILSEYITADKFEVLSRNRMSDSASNSDFEREEINWMGFPKLVIPDQNDLEPSDLVKQISEGRKPKEKATQKEPSTLVADNKDDNKLYNFFVDFLETTFKVYNVKTESSNTASATSSNAALEIDESVAKKLRFKNIENQETLDDVTQKPSKPYYTIADANVVRKGNVPDSFEIPTRRRENREARCKSPPRRRGARSTSPKKRRLTSASFNRPKKPPPISRSDVISHRSSLYKRNKKRDIINLLREQLKMDDYYYDEPQNLYDALKVMSRNKMKCQKTIRFTHKNPVDLQDECMLKRRKIVTASPSFKYSKQITTRKSETAKKQKPIDENFNNCEPSVHSIEVYGFDYDSSAKKRLIYPKNDYFFTYHSSDSDFGNAMCSRSDLTMN